MLTAIKTLIPTQCLVSFHFVVQRSWQTRIISPDSSGSQLCFSTVSSNSEKPQYCKTHNTPPWGIILGFTKYEAINFLDWRNRRKSHGMTPFTFLSICYTFPSACFPIFPSRHLDSVINADSGKHMIIFISKIILSWLAYAREHGKKYNSRQEEEALRTVIPTIHRTSFHGPWISNV